MVRFNLRRIKNTGFLHVAGRMEPQLGDIVAPLPSVVLRS
jgi:hypothetical protein